VYFFPSSHDSSVGTKLDSPFITSRFLQQSCPSTRSNDGTRQATMTDSQDVAGIASLGILLLELCFGQAIERHPSWLALPNAAVEEQVRAGLALVAALEWLKEVHDEAGGDYTEAVEWCLAGCRTMPGDGSWRKLMLERVVEPLERCYGYLV
jgi:hypothetical protein